MPCGIPVPQPGINPCPLHWKPEVLTTGLPGMSLTYFQRTPLAVAEAKLEAGQVRGLPQNLGTRSFCNGEQVEVLGEGDAWRGQGSSFLTPCPVHLFLLAVSELSLQFSHSVVSDSL